MADVNNRPMDRQRQIRERAGLEEARLNQDFIDFLQKWSMPVLVLLAVLAGGYALYTRWTQSERAHLNEAFGELAAVTSVAAPSPDSLRAIAEQYEGVQSVAELARLRAADTFMGAVKRGILVGREVNQDGTLKSLDDGLTADTRKVYLDEAHGLYQRVLETVQADPNRGLIAVSALFGLASVAEARGEVDKAREYYATIKQKAEGTYYEVHAKIAQQRMDTMDKLATAPVPYDRASLPLLPGEQAPNAVAPLPDVGTGTGVIDVGPVGPPAPANEGQGPGATPSGDAPAAPPGTAAPGTPVGTTPAAQPSTPPAPPADGAK